MVKVATEQDRLHMKRALELAERGRGMVSPNPVVGAVIVRDGEVIGEGWHAAYGERHAEVAALADCRERGADPTGATMYVTLEPCAHHGKQPPCTDAILEAGIAQVVIASDDPSEKAAGRGPGILRDGGVQIEQASGEEAAAARLLNQAFRKQARTGRPLVVFKVAMSLDGRVATAAGDAHWISGEASRALVHDWRGELDAVAIGIGTALADDPLLTARGEDPPRQPTRVVFDSAARLPLDSKLVQSTQDAPLIVVAGREADPVLVSGLELTGAEVVVEDGADRVARVEAALAELGRREIGSVLLEGGPTLAASFLEATEVDELRFFIAPILLGADALPVSLATGARSVEQADRALAVSHETVGEDLLVRARLREW